MKKNVARFGVIIALAFIFSYIESLIPIPVYGAYGMKIGLANLIVVTTLYILGEKEAFTISMVRILLVGLTFGNLYSALYSLFGGVLSFLVMVICKKKNLFGIVGISLLGGIFHNIGQLCIAMFVVQTKELMYYGPILIIIGAGTGIVIGIVSGILIDRLKKLRW